MSTILVYGATGPQQRPVAERLLAGGFSVRLFVRDPSAPSIRPLVERGAEAAKGDFDDAASIRAATRGVDGVSLFVPFMRPNAAWGVEAIDAARALGVKRIVWNPTGSILDARIGNPSMDVRAEVYEHLVASGLDWVVIEPTAYLENFLMPALVESVKVRSVFTYPMPRGSRMQWISHEDVAQFVAKAFPTKEVSRERIAVSGPEALEGDEIAERLSRGLGKKVTFEPMPPVEFGRVLDATLGSGTGAAVVPFYEAVFANPSMFGSSVDLPAALARLPIEPTTVEAWARAHRALLG